MGSATSKSSSARKLPVKDVAKRLGQQVSKPARPIEAASEETYDATAAKSSHTAPLSFPSKSADIIKDSQDPHFSTMLRSLGTVSHGNTPLPPSPEMQPPPVNFLHPPPLQASRSSPQRFAPKVPDSVRILQAREQLAQSIRESPSDYLDVLRIRDVVMMREGDGPYGQRGMRDEEIERRLGLKKGILEQLGTKIGHVGLQVRDEKEPIEFIR